MVLPCLFLGAEVSRLCTSGCDAADTLFSSSLQQQRQQNATEPIAYCDAFYTPLYRGLQTSIPSVLHHASTQSLHVHQV